MATIASRSPAPHPARHRSFRGSVVGPLALSVALCVGGIGPGVQAQPAAPEADLVEETGGLTVPPLPDGTPEELLAFVAGLQQPTQRPRSREEMLGYLRDVSRVSVEAADRILAMVPADDPRALLAARLKLEGLMVLGRFGDQQAATAMRAYAASLAEGPSAELARDAARLLLISDAQTMLAGDDLSGGPDIVRRTVEILSADPDDTTNAGLAMQLVAALEQRPDAAPLAAAAIEALGPVFASSSQPQVRQMGDSLAGMLRLRQLPGEPMRITGTRLDGTPFDPAALEGKVVLVDFWATWCRPCLDEIPNVREHYQKYHDRGFEVVGISLDTDRADLERFVKDNDLPWPVLFEEPQGEGWQHPLATFYGITGIPQMILIGRDGKVITLNARGSALDEKLAELFKDAG
jgi:peroxiredoxin